VATQADPPATWSETQNVRWKKPIPGSGTSTPIVWDDRVFLLTAIPTDKPGEPKPAAGPGSDRSTGRGGGGFQIDAPSQAYQFAVICLDRRNGSTLWQRVVREEVPHEGHHRDHGFASASPITNGELLIASFGSRGLYALDFSGKILWQQDFGDMRTRNSFGEGSSPAMFGDTVVFLWDHEGDDFIVALDSKTGRERWRQKRDEPTGWSTPLIQPFAGRTQVVVNATQKVRSYDLVTGEILWESSGQTANAIPSPVAADGLVYVMSGFRGSALKAIRLSSKGDAEAAHSVAWTHHKNTPYVPSPLLVDNLLYFVSGNSGMLSCYDARTGQPHYQAERLEGISGIYASPVAAQDRVYVLGRDGTTVVLKKGPKLEILGRNRIEGNTDASLALVDREIFLRSHENLYCIAP
jgi:outer membrane protein assembly factor BamB